MGTRLGCAALALAITLPGCLSYAADDGKIDDTENPEPLLKDLAGNILKDQKTIWLSPFHANRQNAKWWLLFGAGTAALIATDRQTIDTFHNSKGQVQAGNDISKVGAAYTVVPITAGFYIGGLITDDAKARETGVLGAEALVDALIVQSVLKPVAGRSRPNATADKHEWFDGGASFPSGHAMQSFALASVISHEYGDRKWVPWVAYGLATTVGAARFTAQQHFASDIVAGGAMGWFIGRYVVTHGEHVGHHRRAQFAPILAPSAQTYGLSVSLLPGRD